SAVIPVAGAPGVDDPGRLDEAPRTSNDLTMRQSFCALPLALTLAGCLTTPPDSSRARDPGVRPGPVGAGGPIAGLTATEGAFFDAAQQEFSKPEEVPDGLGPT